MEHHGKLLAVTLLVGVPIAIACIAYPPLFALVILILLITRRS